MKLLALAICICSLLLISDNCLLKIAEAKTMTVNIPESGDNASQAQSRTITIPNLTSVNSISVNTGNVSYSRNGDRVTINVSGGDSVRSDNDPNKYSKDATDYRESKSASFPNTIPYSDGEGYNGTLSKSGTSYVVRGEYIPADTYDATSKMGPSPYNTGFPSSIYTTRPGGYSGNLYAIGDPFWHEDPNFGTGYCQIYSGTLTRPESDTRVWRQDYLGAVYKEGADYYYAYVVTLDYADTHTVTFMDHDGAILKTETVNHGSAATAPADPNNKAGWHFTGWDTAFNNVISDLTVTAIYAINQYTVTFKDHDGTTLKTEIVNHGSAATAPANPTRTGYTFASWDKAFNNVTSNLTVNATYTINQYTITFNSNGGSAVSSITQNYDTVVIAPEDPTKEGYTFDGWSPAVPATMPANDVSLTAQWTINQYTITFNSNGGSAVSSITQNYDTVVIAPEDPTKEGYTFDGWSPAVPATMPANNITLMAQWVINNYLITYVSNPVAGGSISGPNSADYDVSVTVGVNPNIEYDYIDLLLNDSPVATITPYTFNMPASDVTIKANFKLKNVVQTSIKGTVNSSKSITLTWDSVDGAISYDIDISPATGDGTTYISVPMPPVTINNLLPGTEYTFIITPIFPGNIKGEASNPIKVTTKNEYTVTFKDYDGNVIGQQKVDHGGTTVAPTPTRTGYTFTGWDAEISNVTANMIVTAQYTINNYQIAYQLNPDTGGSISGPINANYDKEVTVVASVYTGYDFIYYELDGNMVSANTTYSFNMPAKDVTIKAYFVLKSVDNATAGGTARTSDSVILLWDPVVDAIYYNIYINPADAMGNTKISVTEPYTYTNSRITHIVNNLAPGTQYAFIITPVFPGDLEGTGSNPIIVTTKQIYTVIFNNYDGSEIEQQIIDHGESAVAPADPIRADHTFSGWDKDFSNVTSDLTVTAIYSLNNYMVTFVDHDGAILRTEIIEHGKSAVAPADPIREGHTFSGWDKDFSNVTSNLTINAQYGTNSYTVTFKDYDEAILDTQIVAYGESATAPADPIRTGYAFSGWDKEFSRIVSDLTIYAQYSENASPIGTVTINYQDSEGNAIKDGDVYTNVAGIQNYTAPDIAGYTKPAVDSITFTITTDGQVESHTFVYSKVIALEGLNIIPAQATMNVGDAIQYKVELLYSNGTKQNIAASDVAWSIVDGNDLASITDEGLLAALNIGEAEIGATYIDTDMNLFSAYADVTIIAPLIKGTITIKYQDINGSVIKSSDVYENVTGENTYYAPSINGYELIGHNSVAFIIKTNGQTEEHIFIYDIKPTSNGDTGGDSGIPSQPDPIIEEPEKEPEELEKPAIEEPKVPINEEPKEPEVPEVLTNNDSAESTNNNDSGNSEHSNLDIEPYNTGIVAGRIVKNDGTPMVGVKIELHSKIQTSFTNENGAFLFRDVPFGIHKLYMIDHRFKLGKLLVNKVNVVANSSNITQLESAVPEEKIIQLALSKDTPDINIAIKIESEDLLTEESVTTPKVPVKRAIFGSIKPTTAAATAVSTLAAALLIVFVIRRRKRE
jgi:uncharacterized repeat protein (TIGR02543 family)